MLTKTEMAKMVAAAKRIIKNAYRPALKGAWLDGNGRQIVSDGFRAVRLGEPLPLPESEGLDAVAEALDRALGTRGRAFELPDESEIRAAIAAHKKNTAQTDKSRRVPCWIRIAGGEHLVNAQFLLDMMTLLPNAMAFSIGPLKPITFWANTGDGLMMGVREKGG